jgi:hypothetical protein
MHLQKEVERPALIQRSWCALVNGSPDAPG